MEDRLEFSSEMVTLVAAIVVGNVMSPGWPYDVESGNRTQLEVKASQVSSRGYHWTDPLGSNQRRKVYDRLILVGEDLLHDPGYHFFDVPYSWVVENVHGRDIYCGIYEDFRP
jgi:hypothetical protein